MKTAEIVRLVDKAYSALHVLDNITWTEYREKCRALAEEEERRHRKGAPVGWKWPSGATVGNAGKFFVVKRIAEHLTGAHRPLTLADAISCQPSALFAASLVENYRERIGAAWAGLDARQLAELDYCEFVDNAAATRSRNVQAA
jgi:hypothetical protein